MSGVDHPDGPRTFATWLRDSAPVPPDVIERLIGLDLGRHPTLSELRAALGLDFDAEAAAAAARDAWPGRDVLPSDDDLCAVLDAMYRAVRSTRMVRARCTVAGPELSREGGAITLRDGDHLVLLAFADNETDGSVAFSSEAHGEGVGGHVEQRRSGSALLDAGEMHAGSYLLPVLVVADGRPATIDLPIECRPSGMLAVRILDAAGGEPVAARVYLLDAVGAAWPDGATVRIDQHGNAYFHAEGSFEARVSGEVRVRVARGVEYEPWEETLTVPTDGRAERTARLARWSDMAADGWHSGDVHVHMHYGGEYQLEPEDVALVQRAEDVRFLNMMVANQDSGWVHDTTRFSGTDHALSTATHVLRWGEEYRNDFYGHLCMFGIRALVPPIYSGFRASAHPHDVPANAVAARAARDAAGTLSYAHPMMADGALDRVFERKRAYEAKELPVDAALGLIDAVDVMSYPASHIDTARLWYRLLNCGLRLAATAGSDTFMNCCEHGEFSNPPGGVRAFVRIDGAFSSEAWCAGVRAGRTFVTNAPMLSLEATHAGAMYGVGDEIAARPGDVIRIEAAAGAHVNMERLELLVDGEMVEAVVSDGGMDRAALTYELTARESCWFALRAQGPADPRVMDDAVFAHTSPVYVNVDGAPRRHAADAAYFAEWIERLIAMTEREGRFPDDASRDAVIAEFRAAQAYYRGSDGAAGER
ncbi:MAG TPA: CehA/McbA family metallohydrolase [Dehalococcoidia bacterium]|nr:CehA/McbA family metallohydrolase [Dehalococcoidia bacterium]